MKCPSIKDISAYFDGELEEKRLVSLEPHVRDCPKCAAVLHEMQVLQARFGKAQRYHAPFAFSTRVMARGVELERNRSAGFVPAVIKFAEAAVLLLVIVVGILTGKVMTGGSSPDAGLIMTASSSLDLFRATPPGSLGDAYLAMTEVRNEK